MTVLRNVIKANQQTIRAMTLSLRIPLVLLKAILNREAIMAARNEALTAIVCRCSFNFKLLQLETIRLVKRNGLKSGKGDKFAAMLLKIIKVRYRYGMDDLKEYYKHWKIEQEKLAIINVIIDKLL